MEDMDGANDARLASEDAHQKRVEKGIAPLSALPTGRVAYRDLATINAELQQLATTYPDKVKLFTLNKTSLLGKTIYGVEVSHNVAQNVGKPAFQLTGAHHAREWPTAEFTMEFINDLLMHYGTDADATNLLEKGKLIAVPVVNADGYDLSRSLQNEQKRKNCRITAGVIPTLADCTLAANVNRGIDLNRNYLPFWGGPGSSTSADGVQHARRGPGLRARDRGHDQHGQHATRSRSRSTTTRPTSACCARRAPPTSPTCSPTRPPTRACSTGSRRTSRAGPPARGPTSTTRPPARPSSRPTTPTARSASRPRRRPGFSGTQTFHPPYQNVIDNYLGTGTRYAGQTMRGLYYDAFKAATEPALHSVITGTAPAGATLTLTKAYTLDSSSTVWTTGQPAEVRAFPNAIKTTLTVPASGKFEWHVNPSLRPSQYTRPVHRRVLTAHLHRARRHGAGDDDGQDRPRPGRQPLALHAGRRRRHGAGDARAHARHAGDVRRVHAGHREGVRREHDRERRSARPATRRSRVADPDTGGTGQARQRRVQRSPQPLRAAATSPAGTGAALAAVGGSASPTSLLTYAGPVSNDPVAVAFKQAIGANDALRTGTYSKTLTFTLSTTNP